MVINFLIKPFGFTNLEISIIGALFILCGLVSSVIFPILIEKYHWYNRLMRIICFGAFIFCSLSLIALPIKSYAMTLLTVGLMGFFVIPTMPVAYAFAQELTFPASEALFGSLMQIGSRLLGTFFSYVGSFLIKELGSIFVLIMYSVFYFICFIISFFI